MGATEGATLIINDGRPGGLIACWAEGVVRPRAARTGGVEPPGPVAWFGGDERPALERRREAVRRQAEVCRLSAVSERVAVRFETAQAAPGTPPLGETMTAGARTTAMLMSAAVEAVALRCERVLWPVHAGGARAPGEIDVNTLADITDRAMFVANLIGLDAAGPGHGPRPLTIETPYADLTDAQLMDLALDMDAPLGACWSCLNDAERACGTCSQCMRWREALKAVDPAGTLDLDVLVGA
jgi:7-cyano-7-deazaguanine synthase in queuosine biosynthesis